MKAPIISFRSSKSPFSITTELTSSTKSSVAMLFRQKFQIGNSSLFSVCRKHDSFKCLESTIDFDSSRCSKSFLSETTDLTLPTNFSLWNSKFLEELTSGEPGCFCLDLNLGKPTCLKVPVLLFYRVRCSNSLFPKTRGLNPRELVTKNLLLVMNCSVEEI